MYVNGRGAGLTWGIEKVQQERALVTLLHPHHLLSDVLTGGADTTDRQEDVVV